jgi:chorismate mutase / prephenate dehydratase
MARKSTPGPKKPTTGTKRPAASAADSKHAPSLSNLRGEIDRIDKELVELLNRRAEVAVQIGQIKRGQGLDVWSSARED